MNCPNCGAPKKVWRRCDHCTTPAFPVKSKPWKASRLKERAAHRRQLLRAHQQVDLYRHWLDEVRVAHRDLRRKHGHFQEELKSLLQSWVGWPPETIKVRRLPPAWRVPYMCPIQAIGPVDQPEPQLDDLPTTELEYVRIILRKELWDKYRMHIQLDAGNDHAAYYADWREWQSSRLTKGYMAEHLLKDLLLQMARYREQR